MTYYNTAEVGAPFLPRQISTPRSQTDSDDALEPSVEPEYLYIINVDRCNSRCLTIRPLSLLKPLKTYQRIYQSPMLVSSRPELIIHSTLPIIQILYSQISFLLFRKHYPIIHPLVLISVKSLHIMSHDCVSIMFTKNECI